MPETQLALQDVHAWYGESHILHGMTFHVDAGEVVTLLGRNGAGKTTTMRAIMGLVANRKGSIRSMVASSFISGPIASPATASPTTPKSAVSLRASMCAKT